MAKPPEFILWDTYPLDEDAIPWITLAETDIYPGRVLDPGIQFCTNDRKARWYGRTLFLPPIAQVKVLAAFYPGGDPQRPNWSGIRADLEAGGLFVPGQSFPTLAEIIDRLGRLKGDTILAGQAEGKRVPWRADAPEFLPNSEALRLVDDGSLSLKKLGAILTPQGTMRYMRKGRRCKVHASDFRMFLKSVKKAGGGAITDDAIEAYLSSVETRKAAEQAKKRAGR